MSKSSEVSLSGQTKDVILLNCRLERKSMISSAEECEEQQHRMVLIDTASSNLPVIISFLVKNIAVGMIVSFSGLGMPGLEGSV